MPARIPEEVRIKQVNAIPNIEFLRWADGYKNSKSKANVRCKVDGFVWSAMVGNIIYNCSGCPQCANQRRWTAKERVDQINCLKGVKFIGWIDGYDGVKSKAKVRCSVDNYEWSAAVTDLVNGGYGCPQCSGVRRWTADERIEQINSLENIEFVSWVDGYENNHSKANVKCSVDNFEWRAAVNDIVNRGSGCPRCAKYGYDPSKTGTLYALRSECGRHVKVGISNNPKRRRKDLERETPFKFNLVEQVSGDGVKISELEKYFHNKYESAGFSGFSGCTEWLVCNDELLKEIREMGR